MANEVRLIDANALPYTRVQIFHGMDGDTPIVGGYNAVVMSAAIREAPTIDPESLRPKGRWTENRRKEFSVAIGGDVCWFTYTCSECGGETMNDYQYCPNCGADMTDNKGEIDK